MSGDSRSNGDVLRRNVRARCTAVALGACTLGGCAISFEDADGARHVTGFYAVEVDAAGAYAATGDVHRFTFYGLWIDDAFRGTSLAFGEVELSIADLRNQWSGAAQAAQQATVDCESVLGFQWCSLPPPDPARAGDAIDLAIAGVTVGIGERDRHFGVGYHRKVLLEVTNENALVAWPSHVKVDGLLRGSING